MKTAICKKRSSLLLFLLPVIYLLPFFLTGCTTGSMAEERKGQEINDEKTGEEVNISKEENIDTCSVTIPGISREYRLLFLTDTHITLLGAAEDVPSEIREYFYQRFSQFNAENHFDSSDLFTAWISYANQEKPDALLLGGDIIDSPSPANIQFLGDSLEKLEIPYIYALGNHDWTYPWEYMTKAAIHNFLPLFSPYMQENPAIHTLELDDFIIVAVDNSSNQIHPDALAPYKEILKKGKPVILLLHVPFYTDSLLPKASAVWTTGVVLGGGIHGGIYPNDISAEFMNLTTAKDSPVAAVIAGHVHFSHISNIKGEKEIPQIVGDAGFSGKGTLIHISP